jgi:hypothetical protein
MCLAARRFDEDRKTTEKENAAADQGADPQCIDKRSDDRHEAKGREREPAVGGEHAEKLVAQITDDAH